MNKPQQSHSENYIIYNELFTPVRPFYHYILYSSRLNVYLGSDYIKFSNDVGYEINSHLVNKLQPYDLDTKINLDFDSKILSFMYKGTEVLRLNFDNYVMVNKHGN